MQQLRFQTEMKKEYERETRSYEDAVTYRYYARIRDYRTTDGVINLRPLQQRLQTRLLRRNSPVIICVLNLINKEKKKSTENDDYEYIDSS